MLFRSRRGAHPRPCHHTDIRPSSADSSLVFGPQVGAAKADLIAQLPGDGSSADVTALTATGGTGVPGQLVYGDWCVTANGVVPGSSTQTLYVDDCSDDPKQIWTVNADPATISNADGNCLTLGRAANGVPVRLELYCVLGWVGC